MLNLITNISFLVLILTEIFLNRLLRSKSTDKQNADKHSITLIWATIIAAVSLAVYISKTYYLPIYLSLSVQYIGVAIIYIGIIIRLFAVFSLARFFTVDVTIRQGHKLKKDGLYKHLRHPSYFASLLSFIGLGWTFNNWVSLLLIMVPILIVFIKRIKIEEKVLVEHFGSEYLEYKKVTNGLIPFIYYQRSNEQKRTHNNVFIKFWLEVKKV